MSPSKSENYQKQDELSETARDRKLRKKRHPRKRGYAIRERRKSEIERSRGIEVGKAKERIAKHVARFQKLDEEERRRQEERYLGWVEDSLSQHEPALHKEDVEYKPAVASVKAGGQKRQKTRSSIRATHKPTLISVKNEETRRPEQNKQAAYDNLCLRLTDHLSLWQTLSQNLPDRYSASEIKQHGVDLLKELS